MRVCVADDGVTVEIDFPDGRSLRDVDYVLRVARSTLRSVRGRQRKRATDLTVVNAANSVMGFAIEGGEE